MSRKINKKTLVKTRKERNYYLAYFIEIRRIIPVNYMGAIIIDKYFNEDFSITDLQKYFNSKNRQITKKTILKFIKNLKEELSFPYEGGYPIVEKEEMTVPIAVELQIITRCNLRCKHCCQTDYKKIMPVKKILNILEILYKNKIFEINLTGGEVFLHPNILEVVETCCNKYNFATTVITNGTLLNEATIKKLEKFKKKLSFLVSLEGTGKDNDKIRGNGVFEKVDKTLKALKKIGFHVEISTTINKLNILNYQKLINYSKKLKIPLNFNLFKPFKKNHKDLILEPIQYFNFAKEVFRKRKMEKINIGLTNAAIAAELTNKKKRNTCRATLSGLNINVDGEMVPCSFLGAAGYYKNKKLPKFNEKFLDNWKNNRYFKIFRKGNLRECQACSYIFNGSIKGKDPYGVEAFLKLGYK